MSLTICAVPSLMVEIVWKQCAPIIQRVVDRSHGELTLESVKEKLVKGNAMLVVIADGAKIIAVNTLETREFESGVRALFIPITGGDRLEEWMVDFLDIAKAIAKDFKCTELRGLAVRRGWMKKLQPNGWEFVHEVIRCEIED